MLITTFGLQYSSTPPNIHTRNLNPYISSAFQQWHGYNTVPFVARTPASWHAATLSMAGCSSFGMTGVNAHALFSAIPFQFHCSYLLIWHRQREWPVPSNHPLLKSLVWKHEVGLAR